MSLDQEARIVGVLGQSKEARAEPVGQVDLAAATAEQEETPKNREELRGVADPLTQLLRPHVGPLDLGRAAALDGHERTPERDLEGNFLLGSLGSIRLGPEQIESSSQVCHRFACRAPLRRDLAGYP